MEFTLLNKNNMFENYIETTSPTKLFAFSPKIAKKFEKVSQNINQLQKYTSVYIGNNSHLSAVYFYRCSNDIVYIFLISDDDILEYYLL